MNEPSTLRRRNVEPSGANERTPLLAPRGQGWAAPENNNSPPGTTLTSPSTLQWLKEFIGNLLQQAFSYLWSWSSSEPSADQSKINPSIRYVENINAAPFFLLIE